MVTPAAARVAWTAAGEPRAENLCTRHHGDLVRLLRVVGITADTRTADPLATCQRCPQRKATRDR